MKMFDLLELMELAKRYPIPYMSYSQLNTFMSCPHSYYLTYMTGKFQSNGNKYTILGSLLHEIFETQGKQLIFGENFLTKAEAIREYNKKFMAFKVTNKDYFTDKADFIAMYQKGIKAIENYYSSYTEVAPLFVERKFQGQIAEGLPDMKSFIDRIDGDPEDPSSWIITDYKSGGSPKTKDYLRHDIQLGIYASQLFATFGAYPKAVQFYHPVPNKFQTALHQGDGVYKFTGQRAPVVEFSVADIIMKIREVVADIVRTIDTGNWNKVVDPWNCKMCFHYISGACKPFGEQEGWLSV